MVRFKACGRVGYAQFACALSAGIESQYTIYNTNCRYAFTAFKYRGKVNKSLQHILKANISERDRQYDTGITTTNCSLFFLNTEHNYHILMDSNDSAPNQQHVRLLAVRLKGNYSCVIVPEKTTAVAYTRASKTTTVV